MWSCPVCGVKNADEDVECLGGCGQLHIGRVVVLSTDTSDKNVRLHVRTQIGRRLLVAIDRHLAVYLSECQFTLSPERCRRGWVILHDPTAKNCTRLNG